MPRATKNDTVNDNKENTVLENEKDLTIKELKEQNKLLQEKLEEISKYMMSEKSKQDEKPSLIANNPVLKEYVEPSPNKNIKIISLYYGSLNLSDGKNSIISFKKYGEVKNCIYSKLIDIVNNNLKFAQDGYFYIANEDAVYYLGLSDSYKKIQPKEVLDNICDYDESVIKSIGSVLTDEQKNTISYGLATRKFYGEKLDLNKIDILSKAIGINILDKEAEMRESKKNEELAKA